MRKLFFTTLILTLLFIPNGAEAEDTVRLTTGEWPPYYSEKLQGGGMGWRICSEAFALAGIRAVPEYMPWKRALSMAETGRTVVGSNGWQRTATREKRFYFSDPLFTRDVVFFHLMGSQFDWKTLDDIGHLSIGVTLGYSHAEALAPAVRRNGGQLDYAPTDFLNFEKLLAHRIDLFPCAREVGRYILQKELKAADDTQVRYHPKPLQSGTIHLLISRKHPDGKELVKRFNKGLKQLRASGRYDQIVRESKTFDFILSEPPQTE